MQKGRTSTRGPPSGRSSRSSIGAAPPASGRSSNSRVSQKYAVPIIPDDVESVDPSEVTTCEYERQEAENRRKKKMMIICCCIFWFIIIIVIVIIIVVLSRGSDDEGSFSLPKTCKINGTKAPDSYDDYRCDLLATMNGDNNTFFSSLPTDTAQGKAIGWLTEEDKGVDLSTTDPKIILERFVMAVLYYSTDGFAWYNKFDFLQESLQCDWDGDRDQIACNDQKLITVIDLHQNGLVGKLPTEIGYLTHLTRLRLSNNQLTGNVPKVLGELTELRKLYLSKNEFKGRFPTALNSLSNLETLYVQNNAISGSIDGLCDVVDPSILEEFAADCNTDWISCDCCDICF